MTNLYRPLYRPASFATLPQGVQWDYAAMPPDIAHHRPDLPRSRSRHGVVATTRMLTPEECGQFELQPVQCAD